MAESSRGRFRHPGWIAGGVVAAATAVMAVVAVLDYVRPPGARDTGETATTASPDTATNRPVVPDDSGGATGSPAPTDLADLTLIAGASRLAPLPEELAGEPGYEHAVVIACPSNETGDRLSEVTYETRYLYSTLDAELRPYRDPLDQVLVNLQVFSDPPDREPGAPLPGEPHLEQLRMGEVRPMHGVDIGDSYHLRLRVECQKPSGYMILTGAVLHPAT